MGKKVIILNHGLHISGVSRTLVNFANSLVKHGYDVTIKIEINDFTLKSELDSRVKCSLFLKESHPFGLRIKGFLRFYSKYLKWLLKQSANKQYKLVVRNNYDIEIAFNRGAAAKIISGSDNKNASKLVWVHSDYMLNDNPLAGFKCLKDAQNGYSRFDHIVCVSEQAEKSFAKKFGEGYPTITKYNIMDVERIRKMANETLINKKRFTIVAVGRLCEAKNYELLMDVIDQLNHKGLDIDCWIVGGGQLDSKLIQYKNKKKLENVYFLGSKNNPYPYIKSADLYISTSKYEGLSTTTIEALILEKPCVVTDCTGMRNILGNNEFGVIVPINIDALLLEVEKMMTDKKYREYYSKCAAKRAPFFNSENSFKSIEELF